MRRQTEDTVRSNRTVEDVLSAMEPEREVDRAQFLYEALGIENLPGIFRPPVVLSESQPESELASEEDPAERLIYRLERRLYGWIIGNATLDGKSPVLRGQVTVAKQTVLVQLTWTHGEARDPKRKPGDFEVGNLPADTYELTIEVTIKDRTYSRTWTYAVAAGEEKRVTLRLCGTIKGRAWLREDVPAPHAQVFIYRTGTSMAEDPDETITEETRPDGSFFVLVPREGTYDVTILSQYHTHGKTIKRNKIGGDDDKALNDVILVPLERPAE
jgi:hypothetical protein